MDNLQPGNFVLLKGGDIKPLYLILENMENGNYQAWSCPPSSNNTYYINQLQVDLMPKEAFHEVLVLNKKKLRKNCFILSDDKYSIQINRPWTKLYVDEWTSIQLNN